MPRGLTRRRQADANCERRSAHERGRARLHAVGRGVIVFPACLRHSSSILTARCRTRKSSTWKRGAGRIKRRAVLFHSTRPARWFTVGRRATFWAAFHARFPHAYPTPESLETPLQRHFLALRGERDVRIHGSIDLLTRLAERYPVAIVSGNARRDVAEAIEFWESAPARPSIWAVRTIRPASRIRRVFAWRRSGCACGRTSVLCLKTLRRECRRRKRRAWRASHCGAPAPRNKIFPRPTRCWKTWRIFACDRWKEPCGCSQRSTWRSFWPPWPL